MDRQLCLRFSELELDLARRELRRAGAPLTLEPKVFDLLQYLVLQRDRVVTRSELLDALWPDINVTDASLTSCMGKLRSIIGPHSDDVIKTYYRKGYRFIAPCQEVPARRDARGARCSVARPMSRRILRAVTCVGSPVACDVR